MSLIDELRELPQTLRETLRDELRYGRRLFQDAWHLILLLLIALFALLWFAKPAPPKVVEMAAGRPSDYTFTLAQRYVQHFARNGVELRLIPTEGALDNFERLKNTRDDIKVAMVQGGFVDTPGDVKGLLSLGSIAYEPVWLFYWGNEADDLQKPLTQLLSGPISIGNVGSGTHAKALQLMKINGMPLNLDIMRELPEDQAVAALKRREVNALLLVEHYESPMVQDLLKLQGLVVADFIRARAYAKLLGYIEVLHVPMGGFDLARNFPNHDIQLLSTTTNLIIEDDLHPAIQMLFMEASAAIVGHERFFGDAQEFPSIKDPTIPLSDVAHEYFDKGAPILSYYLPFWLAEFVDRMGLLLVPFLAFAYPILKSIPEFLLKRARKRIERVYVALRRLENEVQADFSPQMLNQKIAALDRMEADVLQIKINKKLVAEFYALRSDIEFVRAILARLRDIQSSGNPASENKEASGTPNPEL